MITQKEILMWLRTLFDSLRRGARRTSLRHARRTPPRRRSAAFQPAIEALEDRLVPASLAVSDLALLEGNSGTQNAAVMVSLSSPSNKTVTVNYSTANGTASAGSDYTAVSGTLSFAPGQTSKSILVPVIGDLVAERDETFFVNLSGARYATIADGQGVVTILNDDPRTLSIDDVSGPERNTGTTLFFLPVRLSLAHEVPVTVSFATQDDTALAGQDFLAASGTLTFAAGETSKYISIAVIGDTIGEPDETFFVNLSGATNAVIARSRGVVSILNDDPRTVQWDGGGGDFNWNNRLNWDGDGLPSPVDNVVIGTAFRGITVNHTSGDTSIRSLNSAAHLYVSSSLLTLNTYSVINGNLTVGGDLSPGRGLTVPGGLQVNGNLTNSGRLTLADSLMGVSGSFSNSGIVVIGFGTLVVDGDFWQITGTVSISVAWTPASGLLRVTGTAYLGGALQIQTPGYLVPYTMAFSITDFGAVNTDYGNLFVFTNYPGFWSYDGSTVWFDPTPQDP